MAGRSTVLDLGGRAVPLVIRHSPTARRMILRIDTRAEGAVVTLPAGVSERHAHSFALSRADWIAQRLAALPGRVPFADGAVVPVLGEPRRVRHLQGARGAVREEGGDLVVAGRPEHLARRLADWLKARARREIEARVAAAAELAGRRPGRITLRDTRSRWGSCAADGDLSFNWRLVMAPAFVLDYVVAHEVAHLVAHNHGPDFHAALARLTPHAAAARRWLKANGAALHRYGEAP